MISLTTAKLKEKERSSRSFSLSENNKKQALIIFILITLVVFLVFMRFSRITADPPPDLSWSAGYYGDEAGYAHNARNKVLFGKWMMDEYNPLYVNPILTSFDFISFKIFHPGILSLRLVALFWGILGIFFVYGTLRKTTKSLWMVFLGIVLLETNYYFLMFTRLSLSDTMLTNCMLMTLFFWALGLRKSAFRFLAGLSAVGVLCCKPTAVYFSIVVLASFVFHYAKKEFSDPKNAKELVKYIFPYITGLLVGGCIWLFFYYIPYHKEFAEMTSGWSFLSMPRGWRDFVSRTIGPYAPIVFKHFSWFPFVLLLGWFYLPVSFYRFTKYRKAYNSLEFFVLFWFIVGYFAISGLRYRPSRYFISLAPPMIILALFGFKELTVFSYRSLKKNWIFSTLYLGWIFLTIFLIRKYIHIKPPVVYGSLIIFCLLAVATWIFKGIFPRVEPHKKFSFYVALLIISLSLSQNFTLYYRWWHKPSYKVINASRDVGKIVKHGIIAGLWAPMICMENRNRALCIASGWFNDQHPYEKYHFTHLFLWRGNRDAELRHVLMRPLGAKFIRERLKPIDKYLIKNAPAVLYKVKSR